MMMRACLIAVSLLMVIGINPASGDIYKYRDDQGVIRYTYDLAEVPEDQRPQVKMYEEESPPSAASPAAIEGEDGPAQEPDADKKEEEIPVVDDKKIEELNQRKKELDKEFAGLMEEKYKLVKEKEKLEKTLAGRDQAAVSEYDNKVKKLNEKIDDYKKRRDAFQKEAEEVKKVLENPGS
jgi:predicted RNase H-like nuclease (RuvC/YqgF family)